MKIILSQIEHRGDRQLAIDFRYDHEVKAHVKAFDNVKWSRTHRTFYVKDSLPTRAKLFNHLRKKGYYVDYSSLPKGLLSRLSTDRTAPQKKTDNQLRKDSEALYKGLPVKLRRILREYTDYLRGKRLSQSTVSTYGYFVLRFLDFSKDISPGKWTNRAVERFMEVVMAGENYSISSHRQCVSGLKHLAALHKIPSLVPGEIQRPKKDRKLPLVLSKEEVIDLLQLTKNLKHRVVLAIIYSCGLRIGELIGLELKNIDLDRRQVYIKMAKGRKDRTVMLAQIAMPLLKNYLHTYRPKRYFVEGPNGGKYSASSIRNFLKAACKRAGINKRITPHTLRHSYATHMMENGVDLRIIQELLGHSKPETTMIYTHVAQKDLEKVQNPLDVAVLSITKSTNKGEKVLLSRNFRE